MDISMNSAVCQSLLALYPLIMLTAVVERRQMAMKLRKLAWFRKGIVYVIGIATAGLIAALIGTQGEGLDGFWALIGWACCLFGAGGLIAIVLASMASTEVEEDAVDVG